MTLIDKLSGKNASVIGRTNVKNSADRLVNGTQIQTKHCQSGKKCINSCFDQNTGIFRYFNPDGTPMQIEVPSDKYLEAIEAFKAKEFKKLFKELLAEKAQDKKIDAFVRHFFDEIILSRPAIAEPTTEDMIELLKQFDSDPANSL